jgi:hypothetical protein
MNDGEKCAEVMRAAGLEPLEPYSGQDAKWLCRCMECGQEVRQRYYFVSKGSGCPNCTLEAAKVKLSLERKGKPNFKNQLDPADAVNVMLAAMIEPLEPYPGAAKPWRCKCLRCGAEVLPRMHNVRKGQLGCSACGRAKAAKARLRSEDEARELMEDVGLHPLEPYPGQVRRWLVHCSGCDKDVYARLITVLSGGAGCPTCAKYGFKSSEPAFVYLLTSKELGAHKIGVANLNTGRLEKHKRRGWTVYSTYDCMGLDAFRIETATLRWLRYELGLPPYLEEGDGWSETVSAALIDADEIWQKVMDVAATSEPNPKLRRPTRS